MKIKILITGAAGFIGKSIIRKLINSPQHFDIYCMDICNIPDSLYDHQKQLTWLKVSFVKDEALKYLSSISPDVLIHLATTMFPNESKNKPVEDCFENLYKTLIFFEKAYKTGTNRIIFASSAGTVYGNVNQSSPVDEKNVTVPLVSYGVTKLSVEHYLRLLATKYKGTSICLRVSNPYGEEQSLTGNQGVIPIFMNKIFHGETIDIWGSIDSTRDYIYINDLSDAFVKAITYSGCIDVMNIATGLSYSLIELINKIELILGLKAKFKIKSETLGKPNHVQLCNKLMKKEFGLVPDTCLNSNIKRIAEYHHFI